MSKEKEKLTIESVAEEIANNIHVLKLKFHDETETGVEYNIRKLLKQILTELQEGQREYGIVWIDFIETHFKQNYGVDGN